jgi:hypothetical protein
MSYWPTQLDYGTTVGLQEKPCTGMYLVVEGAGLHAARRDGRGPFVPHPIEHIDLFSWSASGTDPALVELEVLLRGLKTTNQFCYDLCHILWKPARRDPFHALVIGPIDGPLDRDSAEWPEWTAIKATLPGYDPQAPGRYIVGAWITPRIS